MASNSSSKPRAKKRPRLSNESSNESPGSSLEPNSPPGWNREAVAAAQTASKTHPTLDTAGNPMLNLCNTSLQILMTRLPPVRDVDWRFEKRDINTDHQHRATLGQRLGMVALPGQDKQAKCSFRSSQPPNWFIQWLGANNVNLTLLAGSVAQVVGPPPVRGHIGVPSSVDAGSVPSSTSTRSKQHGPEYSAKWYKTPLDDTSLAKDINGMIAAREDLREIRARVAYDIKKLSKFAGDGGSEEETLEDDEPPNPFYNSHSEHGDGDTGSAHARPKSDGSEVDSADIGSLGVGSVDLNSDVDVDDVDDVDLDMDTSDIDE
ncbi:hypothetical protein PENSOL_c002G04669 [Penicillium solitum]|uniref:Uncharacterized protein n=1 Tax=Penicillium solitum TaxID=60172 RepID=A0A1V6RL86_9EURO|nr:uncharacterized protein PENSOL_c002G04669 [Penicillium solitum]OQE02602.1 hypothetical protein PENSOL_c002G04669 [Penicillium solitum]